MAGTLRIVHMANAFLGNPYLGLLPEKNRECYYRFPEVFDSLFRYIEEEKIDLVLVPGNLSGRYMTSEDAAHLIRRLSEAPCPIVIAPGDQDPYEADSLYASGRLPANVRVFESDSLERIDFDELGVSVYGWAILSQRSSTSPLAGATLADEGRVNLVVGCCDIGARTLFAHVSREELAAFGADYAAFGHGPVTPVKRAGRTQYCHTGFLEGRSFEELGVGGFHRIDITVEEGERRVDVRFVPLSRHRYETVVMDITGVREMGEVMDRLSGLVAEHGFAEDTSLRVILEGDLHPTVLLRQRAEDGNLFSLYSLEFIDRTLPTMGAEELERDMSVRGELYRTLRPRLDSHNLDERLAVAEALRVGLAALESRDITAL